MKKHNTLIGVWAFSLLMLFVPFLASAQSRTINGTVIDARDNKPLQGVSVQVKGSTTGSVTDENGAFTIAVPSKDARLIFTYSGLGAQEITVGDQSSIKVQLSPTTSMQEVLVIGYGTARKSDLTGSVGSVKSTQLAERPATSLGQELAGRIAGVQVNTNSGRPGGQTNIRIRGFSSINTSNNPLYVVDGVILPVGTQQQNSNSIDFINPNDIASVEVLKDASATSIYGARGANGVIMITTKRGTAGGGKITYDADFSTTTIGPKRVEMLNANEYLQIENLAYDNIKIFDSLGWYTGAYNSFVDPRVKRKSLPLLFDANGNPLYNTDWLKESTQSKLSQNHQLGFTGGNADATYGIFLGFRDDNGLLLNSYLQRYSGRFAFDGKIKNWMKAGGTIGYYNQEENIVDIGTGALNSVRMITEGFPFLPVKYPDGNWAENWQYPGAEGGSNPVHILQDRKYIMNTQTTIGNVYVNINLARGLEFRSQLGTSIVTRGINEYNGRTLDQISRAQSGTTTVRNGRETYWSSENYFTYNKQIGEDHSLTAMVGLSWYETNIWNISASAQNFSTDFIMYNNLSVGSQQNAGTSGRARFAFNAYFGRIIYAFKDKYLLTLTGREDGTSKAGEDFKYDFFPSAALAWRASEENFLKDSKVISNLKVRTSYGQTGNAEIPTYSSLARLGNYTAIINDQRVAGIGTGTLANPKLQWEKTSQADFGVELGLFNNRVSIETDVYYRKTTEMLLTAPTPTSSGFSSITLNIGSLENKGWEFTLNTINVRTNNFQWTTAFNISMNRNEVLSLATPAPIFSGNPNFLSNTGIIKVGEPVASFWGLVRLGVWTPAEAAEARKFASYRGGKPILPGDLKYLDVNGDYKINDDDRVIIGNGSAKGWGGFFNNFKYKNFDLVIELQYSYGNDVLNQMHHSAEDRVGIANSFKSVLGAYDLTKGGNQNTMIAAIRDTRAGYVTNVDTRWIEDGSFIRGKNLLLAYNFSTALTNKLRLTRLRVYASVQNFFLATKYSGNDPEVTTYSNSFAQGQTFFDFPKPTTFMLGLNVAL